MPLRCVFHWVPVSYSIKYLEYEIPKPCIRCVRFTLSQESKQHWSRSVTERFLGSYRANIWIWCETDPVHWTTQVRFHGRLPQQPEPWGLRKRPKLHVHICANAAPEMQASFCLPGTTHHQHTDEKTSLNAQRVVPPPNICLSAQLPLTVYWLCNANWPRASYSIGTFSANLRTQHSSTAGLS